MRWLCISFELSLIKNLRMNGNRRQISIREFRRPTMLALHRQLIRFLLATSRCNARIVKTKRSPGIVSMQMVRSVGECELQFVCFRYQHTNLRIRPIFCRKILNHQHKTLKKNVSFIVYNCFRYFSVNQSISLSLNLNLKIWLHE